MDDAREEIKRYKVVGLGEVLWDLLPGGKQLGGAPANFAYHAQQLGAEGIVASAVGDDASGREILDLLDEKGLGTRRVSIDAEHPTGTVSVELDGKGQPSYVIHEGVAWDFLPSTTEMLALAESCNAVCFGTLAQRSPVSRETIRRFLDDTRPDCRRIFDINLRQSYFDADVVRESLAHCNVLKLNDNELPVVAELLSLPGSESEVLGRVIGEYSLDVVALTRGEKGSLLQTVDKRVEHPGCPCKEIADTVGAGDCFTACLTMGALRGDPLEAISESANRRAAYVCSQPGAMPPIFP